MGLGLTVHRAFMLVLGMRYVQGFGLEDSEPLQQYTIAHLKYSNTIIECLHKHPVLMFGSCAQKP